MLLYYGFSYSPAKRSFRVIQQHQGNDNRKASPVETRKILFQRAFFCKIQKSIRWVWRIDCHTRLSHLIEIKGEGGKKVFFVPLILFSLSLVRQMGKEKLQENRSLPATSSTRQKNQNTAVQLFYFSPTFLTPITSQNNTPNEQVITMFRTRVSKVHSSNLVQELWPFPEATKEEFMGNGFFIAPLGWRNPCRTEFTNGKILVDCVMVLMLQYRQLSQLMHRFYLIIRILIRHASWFRMNKRYDENQTQNNSLEKCLSPFTDPMGQKTRLWWKTWNDL